ncbi:IS1 family transposase [Xenorhabdus sp. PB61.4]|uniref:IS1 family transposase n=1 Tax=Xenorhabdus sp. PB61.4 TaxID=2788940 RepID=UPI00351CFD7E
MLTGKLHMVSKHYTQCIERYNLNLRQCLAKLPLMSNIHGNVSQRIIRHYLNIHHNINYSS